MFKSGTVFVVGAGASAEFGMPVGSQLAATISQNLTLKQQEGYSSHLTDLVAHRAIQSRFQKGTEEARLHLAAAAHIRAGIDHAMSIDSFIDMHSDKPAISSVGKLQIALSILRAERQTGLYVNTDNSANRIKFQYPAVRNSWMRPFTEILLEKSRAVEVEKIGRGVSIICFNYDRCIEHYLIDAIERTMLVSRATAHKVVYDMNIIHPYGHLGKLPVARGGQGEGTVEFGADVEGNWVDPWSIAANLSTFTEEIKDAGTLAKIHSAIASASRLVFLGFSFQPQNMRLLTPPSEMVSKIRVMRALSSGFGIHQVAVDEVKGRILGLMGAAAGYSGAEIMVGDKCADVMNFNRLSLADATA